MGLIESVEFLEISIATGETSDSANLTKSQTTSNCVLFVTKGPLSGQTSNFDQVYLDAYFESSPDKVTVERSTSGGTITVAITVVEFGTDASIQQGTFSMAATEGSDTVSITSVTQSKSAFTLYYQTDGVGNTKFGPACVRGKFNADDELIFERDDTDGAISGHFYLFECNNTEFSVQAITHDIAASTTSKDTTITEVDTDKTFMISSFKTLGGNDDVENYCHSLQLTTSTNINSARYYAKNESVDCHVFVIEFESGSEQVVQRGSFSYGSASTNENDTLTAVDLLYAMPWNSAFQGCMQTEGSDAADVETAWQRLKLTSATQIDGYRDAGQIATGIWECVEWRKPNYQIKGNVYNRFGATLTDANLVLLKDNQDDTMSVIDYTTSNQSGYYIFENIVDKDSQYQIYAYIDDSPHVFDVTDHILEPLENTTTCYDLYLRSDVDKGEVSPSKNLRLRAQSDKKARRIFIIS